MSTAVPVPGRAGPGRPHGPAAGPPGRRRRGAARLGAARRGREASALLRGAADDLAVVPRGQRHPDRLGRPAARCDL